MRDRDVRVALRGWIRVQHGPERETRVVEELEIAGGETRIDFGVINGLLHGLEIKSDRDTLRRLPAQRESYQQVFDRLTLVVGRRHLAAARREVPDWWGLCLARSAGQVVAIEPVRPAGQNPLQQPLAIARLLWREEALAALREFGLERGVRSRPRRILWARLAAEVPLEELKSVARRLLKNRPAWRAGP